MRLNKATNHAIRLLVACARSPRPLVKVAELSEQLELTAQNAFKIVHLLSRAGFVKAVRGRHGGVQLAHPASGIRVGDVVRAMERLSSEVSADADVGSSDQASGPLFDEAFEAFIQVLNQSSIADMAAAHRGKTTPRGRDPQTAPRKTAKSATRREPRRSEDISR